MTWFDLSELVSQELRKFEQLPQLAVQLPKDNSQWLNIYGKAEQDSCAAVDASIRRFARDRTWPALSPVEGYFLRERLRLVLPIAMLMATMPSGPGAEGRKIHNHPPELDDETQIEWILKAQWELSGRLDWLGRVKRAIQMDHIGEI
jgi:hypothetical protein